MKWRNERSTVKGLAAGAIGGLVASWVMGYVHTSLKKWAEGDSGAEAERQAEPERSQGRNRAERRAQARPMQGQQPQEHEEPANLKAAVAVAENVFEHPLEEEEKQTAGSAVHYVFGSVMGGLYGMAAEQWDFARWGEGALFGAALWFGSDEIAVPALKLSRPPQEYELKVHAAALASHVVYGVATELVRRALRAGVLAE